MTEWFGPEAGRWFSLLSLMSLAAGVAPWVARGERRGLVMRIYFASIALGCLFLGASLLARVLDQPGYVVRPLLVAGIAITACFLVTLPVVIKGYADAEQRKILARDM